MNKEHGRLTMGAKQTLESALREALSLGHNYIGDEHILLAIMGKKTLASIALQNLGLTAETIRDEIVRLLCEPPKPRKNDELIKALRVVLAKLEDETA